MDLSGLINLFLSYVYFKKNIFIKRIEDFLCVKKE